MFSFTETRGQPDLLHQSGTVEFNTTYVTQKKPLWWIALKLLAVAAMVAVGYGLLLPTFLELNFGLWQAVAIATGLMMVYVGVAFFVRPEANTDNLGLCGGLGNDPYQSSDNVNRFLWRAHCFLGPGRFTSETLLDACVLLGLARGEEVIGPAAAAPAEPPPSDFTAAMLSAAMDPHRATSVAATSPEGTVGAALSPSRFEQPAASLPGDRSALMDLQFRPPRS